ncbi:hypothetical protein EW146_g8924 [Bondarzewia mesenterica]|uniref:Uncharacterized protein n=1 Tax=Bondarzewia mesenterica TaxID=1095465 RepID=A0A4S4LCC4_9AGAM|nr:hypothetical protein EW146_g8924 [Bondarzewia mesenterica]
MLTSRPKLPLFRFSSTNASLPSTPSFWSKFKGGSGGKKQEPEHRPQQVQMALSRQRLLTLVYGDMETVRMLPSTYAELDALARDWIKPPPEALFGLRVPIDYVHIQTARLVSGDYVYLTGEDSYQIATMGVPGIRVEIVSDGPPPPDEPPYAASVIIPHPFKRVRHADLSIPLALPPVLEMPATFNLELTPGQHIALDTTVSSDELDMARMEDGTTVDGMFWGKLDIVHDGDTHKMEFSGTRLANAEDVTPELMVDSRMITKLAVAAKPSTAKCRLSLLAPSVQYCDVTLSCSPMWKLGLTWPQAEAVDEGKVKYFLRVHPGGGFEHFETEMVATSIYYEAMPEPSLLDPNEFVAPRNSFAMSFGDFIPHLMNVLDQLGLSVQARTDFINTHLHDFSAHKNIAYRFLSPARIAAAIDMSVTADDCVFTRLFLIFRGLSDDDLGIFAGAGEKEANAHNWRELVGWSENSKDPTAFRVLETSVLEVS